MVQKSANTLGERLRRLREDSGLTQEQAAKLAGISRRSLAMYENGEQEPPAVKFDRLQSLLKSAEVKQAIEGNPVYEMEVSAGHGALAYSENIIGYVQSPLRGAFWVRVSGDSMEPTLRAGTAIQVLPFVGALLDIHEDGIYVYRLEHAIQCKRIQLLPGGVVRIISDNTQYPTFNVNMDAGVDFQVIGRVVL